MKKSLLIAFGLFPLLCFAISNVSAQTIAVVKSANIKPYEEALEGFKTVMNSDFKEIVLSDDDPQKTMEAISKIKPDLIFAIGLNALLHVKSIGDIPIVYAMVLSPQSILEGKKNITGVSLNISAQKELDELLKILPGAKTVGIVYDPQKTRHLVDEVRDAAVQKGLSVISRVINNPRDAPTAIKDIMGSIDVFWLLPDTTVITQETLEYLFLASIKRRVPVLAFSDIYLGMGALLALNIDAEDIGKQAGNRSKRILEGAVIKRPAESPRKVKVLINFKIAKKMGINIEKDIDKKRE